MVRSKGLEPLTHGLTCYFHFREPSIRCCSLDYIITVTGVSRIVSEEPIYCVVFSKINVFALVVFRFNYSKSKSVSMR